MSRSARRLRTTPYRAAVTVSCESKRTAEQQTVSAVRVAMETVSQLRLVKDLAALRLEGN